MPWASGAISEPAQCLPWLQPPPNPTVPTLLAIPDHTSPSDLPPIQHSVKHELVLWHCLACVSKSQASRDLNELCSECWKPDFGHAGFGWLHPQKAALVTLKWSHFMSKSFCSPSPMPSAVQTLGILPLNTLSWCNSIIIPDIWETSNSACSKSDKRYLARCSQINTKVQNLIFWRSVLGTDFLLNL